MNKWYVVAADGRQQEGPLRNSELVALARAGHISRVTKLRNDAIANGKCIVASRIRQLQDIFDEVESQCVPPYAEPTAEKADNQAEKGNVEPVVASINNEIIQVSWRPSLAFLLCLSAVCVMGLAIFVTLLTLYRIDRSPLLPSVATQPAAPVEPVDGSIVEVPIESTLEPWQHPVVVKYYEKADDVPGRRPFSGRPDTICLVVPRNSTEKQLADVALRACRSYGSRPLLIDFSDLGLWGGYKGKIFAHGKYEGGKIVHVSVYPEGWPNKQLD